MAKGLFVTGTDTGVGKTLVSLGLMRLLQERGYRVAGMKPVASGCDVTVDGIRNPDALALMAQASVELPYARVNPYAFPAAVAPHIAADECNQTINIGNIKNQFRKVEASVDYVVVEGIGGWKVPLGEDADVSDLAVALGLPVLLVVAVRLGCLNYAILTWEAIRASGLPCAGWVANCLEADVLCVDENIACLTARLGMPPAGTIRCLAEHGEVVESVAQNLILNARFL